MSTFDDEAQDWQVIDDGGGWCVPGVYLDLVMPSVVRGGIKFTMLDVNGQPAMIPSPKPYPPVCDCGQRGGTNHKRTCPAYAGKYPERSEPMSREDRAQELLALITRAEKQLANLDRIPDVDEYADGAVLRVIVRTRAGWPTITYVLLKVTVSDGAQRWYHTGKMARALTKDYSYFTDWSQVQSWLMSVHELVGIELMVPQSDVTAAQLDAAAAAATAVAEAQSRNVKNLGILPNDGDVGRGDGSPIF